MLDMNQDNGYKEWIMELERLHLPRWDELPELDLYMDQVVTLVERYLNPLLKSQGKEKLLTKSMVNNYVKLQLIPAPIKKQYSRKHLAYLIAITVLKQVVTIKEVRQGVLNLTMVVGEKNAYNYFVEEQEKAVHLVAASLAGQQSVPVEIENTDENKLALRMAAAAFAAKIAAEKLVEVQSEDNPWSESS